MQLIFLVETNKSCGSDWMYISTLIKNVYDIKGHKLTDVYMGGKTNFGKRQTEIDQKIKKYNGISEVFVCIDIDKENATVEDVKRNKQIEDFCKLKKYTLIWFKRDIEDVFLGKSVESEQKKQEAERFLRKNSIKKLKLSNLNKNSRASNQTSNILFELDKRNYLSRK